MGQSYTIDLTMNTGLLRVLSRAIFFLGVLFGFALAVIMIWSKLEAIHYFFNGAKYEPFSGLRCPLMLAPTEEGIVSAVFKNPTEKEVNFFYRAEISGSVSTRRLEGSIAVAPHQTKLAQLMVDANDVDLLFFIFVKMNILPNSLHGSEQAVCGIRVTNILGLTGKKIALIALAISFLGMAFGLGMNRQTGDKKDRAIERVMQVLGVIVLLTLIAGATGLWLPGMALSAITILLMIISVRIAIA